MQETDKTLHEERKKPHPLTPSSFGEGGTPSP